MHYTNKSINSFTRALMNEALYCWVNGNIKSAIVFKLCTAECTNNYTRKHAPN